ncbi:keratin-associated protein 16-1-like [Armigeres subalbatus]|uniref:keratin-associated protein 16-1-like n=1 Tax=Armigeres subalbatus TaxID=124917 RepID=UPI002ED06421
MLMKILWSAFVFAVFCQSAINAAGICGNATIRKHWSDCRKFVECGEFSTVIFECPERSYFNPETLVCDFAMYAECVTDLEAEVQFFGQQRMLETTPGVLVTIETCNQHRLGIKLPHPINCNQFYHCSPSGPVLFTCPAELLFCPERLVCNWPQFVTCGSEEVITPSEGCQVNCFPDNRCPINCYPDLNTTVLPHPSRCDAFLRCIDGCACFEDCTPGLYWSSNLGRCVERYRSECTEIERPACPSYNCAPSDLCPQEDPDYPIRFPHPERCDAFKQCFEGELCTIECPDGLEFNPEEEVCDIPWGCIDSTTVSTTTVTPTTVTPTTVTPPIDGPTDETITEAPTTVTPTTVTPTTVTPTTVTPTTVTPTTVTPTTVTPTTVTPTTVTPTTVTPTTVTPTTVTPTTVTPTTVTPTTVAPTTVTPTTVTPTTVTPTTVTPTTVTPTTVTPNEDDDLTTVSACPTCPPGACTPDDRCPTGGCQECDPLLLPHPDNCGMFLKCTHGFACEMTCPDGLHWSSALNRCEWPENGDCASTPQIKY